MVARMLRIAVALAAGLASVSLVGMPSALAGGGGCHAGVTQGSGDTIEIVDSCFTPTTLYVEPGTKVTWVNNDRFVHNVTANTWGYFDALNNGDVFSATFPEDGVYPFACTYHFGMTGAIVVGDGVGTGSGDFVSEEFVSAFEEKEPEPAPLVAARSAPESSSTVGWWIGGGIGLLIGVGLTLVVRRLGSAPDARES